MELLFVALFGFVLFVAGHKGLIIYARTFFHDPATTMSADMLLALLKGPGAMPAVLCMMAMFSGVCCIAIPIYAAILMF